MISWNGTTGDLSLMPFAMKEIIKIWKALLLDKHHWNIYWITVIDSVS